MNAHGSSEGSRKVSTYASAAAFLDAVQEELEAHEAANNLMLGLAMRLSQQPAGDTKPTFLATVSRPGAVTVAALMTPGRRLVIQGQPVAADMDALVASLLAASATVPAPGTRPRDSAATSPGGSGSTS